MSNKLEYLAAFNAKKEELNEIRQQIRGEIQYGPWRR